jgi:hypothetical protein
VAPQGERRRVIDDRVIRNRHQFFAFQIPRRPNVRSAVYVTVLSEFRAKATEQKSSPGMEGTRGYAKENYIDESPSGSRQFVAQWESLNKIRINSFP